MCHSRTEKGCSVWTREPFPGDKLSVLHLVYYYYGEEEKNAQAQQVMSSDLPRGPVISPGSRLASTP